jgi:hypothetical protein
MDDSSQVFCASCRRYKPPDQFNQARNGRPYKTCRACSESRRRQPLGDIDPNSRSLRGGVRRPAAPIRQSRQPKRRRLGPVPAVEQTHAPVQAGQGPAEAVDGMLTPYPLLSSRSVLLIPDAKIIPQRTLQYRLAKDLPKPSMVRSPLPPYLVADQYC